MNRKKLFFVLILLFAVIPSFTVTQSFAQSTIAQPALTGAPTESARQQRLQTADQTRITNLMKRADTEISRRTTALNALTARISEFKHISDAQKSSFSQEITAEISNLTALKTKIDADTDLTTLKTDVQSIVLSYRVFALFIPQLHIIAASDRILDITDMMSNLATKLASRITDAQTAGQNVTSLQTLLTDMQSKIADAKTQANNSIATVTGLLPTGYPGNKSSLTQARTMLAAARQDLIAARDDARKIIQGLKAFKTTITPTASINTPTP